MKKILFIVLSACLLCSFVSCNNEVKAKSNEVYKLPEITVKDEDLETASAKAVLAQLNSLYSTVNLMLDNGLEVPEQTKGMGESNIDFMDLINYMPKSKAAGDDSAFNNQLEQIAEDYSATMTDLVPDYSSAVDKDLLVIDEQQGVIYMSEDEVIPINSVEGIMALEIANLIAEGKTPNEAIALVNASVQKVVSSVDDTNNTKGLYSMRGRGYRDGEIKYFFRDGFYGGEIGNYEFSEKEKKAIREAMDDWEEKTDNAVKFTEVEFIGFTPTLWALGLNNTVCIKPAKLGVGTRGESTVGNVIANVIKFDVKQWYDKDGVPIEDYFKRVPRHELGHTLGLKHEQQRPNRGEYLQMSDTVSGNSNNDIYEDKVTRTFKWLEITWDYYTKKILWWYVDIWYPVFNWRTETVVTNYTGTTGNGFDFNSIMLYSGIRIKEKYANSFNGDIVLKDVHIFEDGIVSEFLGEYDELGLPILVDNFHKKGDIINLPCGFETRRNVSLSQYDIEAVKKHYPKILRKGI